jgi:hypothetical protein
MERFRFAGADEPGPVLQYSAGWPIVAPDRGAFIEKWSRGAPKSSKTPPESPVRNTVNDAQEMEVDMRYLVDALRGRIGSKENELDAFMRRLDRIAAERGRPLVSRRAA